MIFLKPILYYLFSPVGFLIPLIGVTALLKKRRYLILPIFWLYIFSTQAFTYLLLAPLELPFPPQKLESLPRFEYGVLLGGGLGEPTPPYTTDFNLGESSDRIIHAARLYHAKVINKILVLSGPLSSQTEDNNQGIETIKLLTMLGVSPKDMDRLPLAETTFTEAIEVKKHLQVINYTRPLYLITSAFHMRRAISVYKAQDLDVRPGATDHHIGNVHFSLKSFIPHLYFLFLNVTAWKEHIGFLYYFLVGRITP